MARLVLHVGTHKTATTTVQKSFHANRALLARHGMHYPDIGRTAGHHGLVADWVNLAPVFHLAEGSERAWRRLVRQYAKKPGTVFLSSEEFSRGHPKARVDFAAIRSWLDPFEEVQVVCTLRDQVSLVQSVYLELAKKQAPPFWTRFLQNTIRTGYCAGLFLDYNALDDHLQTGFAPSEIRYLDYAGLSAEGGVLGRMLDLAGCPLDPGRLQTTADQSSANVSPDPLSAWVATMIARPKAADEALLALCRDKLARTIKGEKRTAIYLRQEYIRLAGHVAPMNAAFAERLADRQPGFAITVPDPPADMVWRGMLQTDFWVNLTRALYNP